MKSFRYRMFVEWSDDDEAFVARIPALGPCAAHGDTPEEAAREARVAAEGILESLKEHGDPVPPEDVAVDYSGQLRLRLPSSLHQELARLASVEGVSLNQELLSILAEGYGRKRAGHEVSVAHRRRSRPRKRAA